MLDASDAVLMQHVRDGADDAYALLWSRHEVAARALARRVAPEREVDDLVSESFLRVLRALRAGGGPETSFRPYLLSTLRRANIDAGRRYHQRVVLTDDDTVIETSGAPTPEELSESRQEERAAWAAWASLPDDSRDLLWKLVVDEQTPAQLAHGLGTTPNGVSSRAKRARERLRQAFLTQHTNAAVDEGCRSTRIALGGYVRSGLSERDRRRVEDHLGHCAMCRAALLEVIDVDRTIRTAIVPLAALIGGAGAAAAAGALGAGSAAGAVATGSSATTSTATSATGSAAGSATGSSAAGATSATGSAAGSATGSGSAAAAEAGAGSAAGASSAGLTAGSSTGSLAAGTAGAAVATGSVISITSGLRGLWALRPRGVLGAVTATGTAAATAALIVVTVDFGPPAPQAQPPTTATITAVGDSANRDGSRVPSGPPRGPAQLTPPVGVPSASTPARSATPADPASTGPAASSATRAAGGALSASTTSPTGTPAPPTPKGSLATPTTSGSASPTTSRKPVTAPTTFLPPDPTPTRPTTSPTTSKPPTPIAPASRQFTFEPDTTSGTATTLRLSSGWVVSSVRDLHDGREVEHLVLPGRVFVGLLRSGPVVVQVRPDVVDHPAKPGVLVADFRDLSGHKVDGGGVRHLRP